MCHRLALGLLSVFVPALLLACSGEPFSYGPNPAADPAGGARPAVPRARESAK